MSDTKMDWVSKEEAKKKEERSKEYFNIEEGANKFVLLSHCAPMVQVFDPATKKYRFAQEGDKNTSVKGICWVLQDDMVKMARLPYSIVKAIKALQNDEEWDFTEFPFPHVLTLSAKGAGTKEVEYTFQPSPKKVEISKAIMDELAKKPSPEEMIEKMKEKAGVSHAKPSTGIEHPTSEINPDDVPF